MDLDYRRFSNTLQVASIQLPQPKLASVLVFDRRSIVRDRRAYLRGLDQSQNLSRNPTFQSYTSTAY